MTEMCSYCGKEITTTPIINTECFACLRFLPCCNDCADVYDCMECVEAST